VEKTKVEVRGRRDTPRERKKNVIKNGCGDINQIAISAERNTVSATGGITRVKDDTKDPGKRRLKNETGVDTTLVPRKKIRDTFLVTGARGPNRPPRLTNNLTENRGVRRERRGGRSPERKEPITGRREEKLRFFKKIGLRPILRPARRKTLAERVVNVRRRDTMVSKMLVQEVMKGSLINLAGDQNRDRRERIGRADKLGHETLDNQVGGV
jgi:hypothetical protein